MRSIPTKLLGSAAVIFDEQGRVLLVKHSYGRLNRELPGGRGEESESIAATAVQEVREETGLEVRAEALTGIYYQPWQDMHHFVFRCVRENPAATPRPDAHEITDCGYWPPEDLPRPISDFTVRRIGDALSGASSSILPVAVTPPQWLE
ncbi:MAG: NUDIX domain-containing protein [Chloroflexi bacterium]|nr:NUDIX domain-containing protein [Chloroflexota bacterium]